MYAPEIMAATMSEPRETGPSRALWQYHSRSDHHSKVSCWAVLFDLLCESALLRDHVAQGKVYFGVNHTMTDWVNRKKKRLDLVVCRADGPPTGGDFLDLGRALQLYMPDEAMRDLEHVPVMFEAPVGAVLVALEAKAAMTAHVKALPRLFDELNSSHQIVHGASNSALSIGMVTVNVAHEFVSSDLNREPDPRMRTRVSTHRQPDAAVRVLEMVDNLPRRTGDSAVGYDGLGVVALELVNDCATPVTVHHGYPAPRPGELFHYETMLRRMANEYDARFYRI